MEKRNVKKVGRTKTELQLKQVERKRELKEEHLVKLEEAVKGARAQMKANIRQQIVSLIRKS